MGPSFQELKELGYIRKTSAGADYCLRTSHLWEERPSLKVHEAFLPPHCGILGIFAKKEDITSNLGDTPLALTQACFAPIEGYVRFCHSNPRLHRTILCGSGV